MRSFSSACKEALQQRGTLTGEPAYRLYLDDLLAIYTELLGQYRGVGNRTDFVTRLRRYAGLILQQEKN